MTPHDAAISYCRRGWSPLPIPYRSKNPGFNGWERCRIKEANVSAHFNSKPQNIGILMGEPSGWTVDVDLDHPRCVELADQYLPPTPAVFGRPSKPRSHRIYRVSAPVATKKHKSKSAGMLVELRSTGAQTVFPPSTHACGEAITWEADDAEPAQVDPAELLAAVERLANAVKVEIGERVASNPPKAPKPAAKAAASPKANGGGNIGACVASMLRMTIEDHKDGSGRLFAAACRVVEHDLSDVDGVAAIRDYARQKPFPTEWTDQQILDRIRDAEQKTRRGVIRRIAERESTPTILIDTDEHRVVTATVKALAADPDLYQRGGMLVRVLREQQPDDGIVRCNGSATIAAVPQAHLRERMTRFATFSKYVRQGDAVVEIAAHPTPWLVAGVDARGNWPGIRQLMAVSDCPVIRADGTIWQNPGYDPATGVLYEPSEQFPTIPDDLTADDVWAAVETLLEVVCDFRFENEEHRAAWLGALLTPLARFAFLGPSPLFLVDANVRGAGKGLLVQVIAWIVLGREMPVFSYAHESEEMRKKITSIAIAGDGLVLLDNLEGNFGNDALDRALTSTRWKDRILGKSEMVDLPLMPAWYGTGNNVAVAADTTRRIIHVRLDVLEEHPEDRKDFKHPDLLEWIRRNRGKLLCSAITILAAYCRAGRPSQNLSSFGSFEGWSSIVRQAVVWAGLPDPCKTRTRLVEFSDTTSDAIGQLIHAWQAYDPGGRGLVVSDLLAVIYRRDFQPSDDASVAMRAAIENFVGCPPGKVPNARQVGNKLRTARRRVIAGFMLDANPHDQCRNGAVWKVQAAEGSVVCDSRDSRESFSAPFAHEGEAK
jgi:hypothetical protein